MGKLKVVELFARVIFQQETVILSKISHENVVIS